jgi:hypothetical protein
MTEPIDWAAVRGHIHLDPAVTMLNTGSFGPLPHPVFDRVTDLRRKLAAGEPITIVDLRHRLDFEADPRTLPGALRFDTNDLEQRHGEIPRDRDVVLYCT